MSADLFAAFAARVRPSHDRLLAPSVGPDGEPVRALLAAIAPLDLSAATIRSDVAGNLWMLTPEAFAYFLPAFMTEGLARYDTLASFVAELVSALTAPTRDDVVQSLDRLAQFPAPLGLPAATLALLRPQQLEWFDSGAPVATFRARAAALTRAESAAVLAFLAAVRDERGADFVLGEPQLAIDRHWAAAGAP